MRKLGYVAILIICLGAGLGVGIIRRNHRPASADGGFTINPDSKPIVPVVVADNSTTTTDPGVAATATASDPAAVAVATPELDPATGRAFAGGGTKEADPLNQPKKAASGHVSEPEPFTDDAPVEAPRGKQNTVASGAVGKEIFEGAQPRATKPGKVAKAEPAPEVQGFGDGDLNDLPVIDDPQSTKSAPPPPPPPVADERVAMINNSPGDLTFPSGSGAALKKITQRQNGDKSVVHIERSGSMKYLVFKLRNPNRVWVDFEETAVPGGDPQPVAGLNHVKEISARYIKNSGGGIPKARVQILLTDEKIPNIDCHEAGAAIDCTIGGATEKF